MKKAKNEVQVETPVTVEAQEVKTIGRKIDPTSKRQQLLSKREAAKASGTFKKGRPIIGTSKRQEVLAKRQAKIEANGELKKGRPSVAGSKRQLALEAKAAKLASGIEVKKGRPKVEKVEAVIAEEIVVEATVEKATSVKRKK